MCDFGGAETLKSSPGCSHSVISHFSTFSKNIENIMNMVTNKWSKSMKNRPLGAQESTFWAPKSILEGLQKTWIFDASPVVQKIDTIGPKIDREAPSDQRNFASCISPGGLGPWSGLARDQIQDIRSKKQSTKAHETWIMKHVGKKLMNMKQKQNMI